MAYTKTIWQDGVTPLSATNMNHLETQYDAAKADIDAHATRTDNPHAVTPAQIGAVNKAGDTMTGDLEIGIDNTFSVYGFTPFTFGYKSNVTYRKIATLPVDDVGNYANLRITGTMAGWIPAQGKVIFNLILSNRESLVFTGYYTGSGIGYMDFHVYQNPDNTVSIYAVTQPTYVASWSLDMSGQQITWDYRTSTETTTTPIGTFLSAFSTVAGKVWHAGNDGAGSGLDADMLDGKHLSDIRLIDKTGTFVSDFALGQSNDATYVIHKLFSNIITNSLERRYADITISFRHGVDSAYIYTTYTKASYQIGTSSEVFSPEYINMGDGGGGILYVNRTFTVTNVLVTEPVTVRVYAKSDGTHYVYVLDVFVTGTTYTAV